MGKEPSLLLRSLEKYKAVESILHMYECNPLEMAKRIHELEERLDKSNNQ